MVSDGVGGVNISCGWGGWSRAEATWYTGGGTLGSQVEPNHRLCLCKKRKLMPQTAGGQMRMASRRHSWGGLSETRLGA